MLTAGELRLIREDTGLPGLAVLLDTRRFADFLRARLPVDAVSVAAKRYIRYKPRTNCLVGYDVELNGSPVFVYARALAASGRIKLAKVGTSRGGVKSVDGLADCRSGIEVSFFPYDRKLKSLWRLFDSARRDRLLREVLGDDTEFQGGRVETLAYKPLRRFVGRLEAANGRRAVVKAYTPHRYPTASRNAVACRFQGVRMATSLGSSDARHIIVFDWQCGRPLSELYGEEGFDPRWVGAVGEHLARLHQSDPGAWRKQLPPGLEIQGVHARGQNLAFVLPTRRRLIEAIHLELAAKLELCPPASTLIHGDFYAKQVLVSAGRVSLLDVDDLRLGDPAYDLGLFLAHLERDVLRGRLSERRRDICRSRLLCAYQAAGGIVNPYRVDLRTAQGLVELAHHPFRLCEPYWEASTEALLTMSRNYLRASCSAQYRGVDSPAATTVIGE